jgi:hypothetical protein
VFLGVCPACAAERRGAGYTQTEGEEDGDQGVEDGEESPRGVRR